ncbi:hypothetical protein PF005_g28176 [Phytophthora fragariae]|uniref:RxLR effector protein n=1 Tax=Phytophthora fragariae TaxID=53985 RepID=A0A6A3QK50_9STRA|nr:hypothetical protein PF003_g34410 [Phytophthora fragariae]KAE8921324.1 hypothetical protein PF009_g28393 [Phytophthora fragariae]KAE9065585.1 hypothetical protein PF007_g28794 [Phytophthora fragariae]KAE9078163.1 hypothetical protein PF006_g27770 [Phytophthora fragariae]KAE9168926.1 hypothetical protein PF005_g28176 [Phytophthora fragariae]
MVPSGQSRYYSVRLRAAWCLLLWGHGGVAVGATTRPCSRDYPVVRRCQSGRPESATLPTCLQPRLRLPVVNGIWVLQLSTILTVTFSKVGRNTHFTMIKKTAAGTRRRNMNTRALAAPTAPGSRDLEVPTFVRQRRGKSHTNPG